MLSGVYPAIFLAERQGSTAGHLERTVDFKVEVEIVMTLSTRGG
jgi:hypothetical protein